MGIRKHLSVEEAWRCGAEEAFVVGEQGGEGAECGGGVGEEGGRVDERAAGGGENLSGGGGAESVGDGGPHEARRREVEGGKERSVGWVKVESVKLRE